MQQKIFQHFHICISSVAIILRKTDVFGTFVPKPKSYVVDGFKILLPFHFPLLEIWRPFCIFYKEDNVDGRYKKPSRIPSFLGAILERRRLEKKISATKEEVVCHLLLYRKEGDLLGDVVLFSKRKLASQEDLKITSKLIFL